MAENLLKGGEKRKGAVGSFPVPQEFSPAEKRWAQSVNDSLQQLTGEKGNKLDSAVTFADLINSGLAETLNIQILGGGGSLVSDSGGVNILKSVTDGGIDFPTAPTGVSADGAFKNIIIDWDYPNYQGHSHTEIFVADTNSFASVEITKGRLSPKFLGQTTATVLNHAVGNNQTKFYWIRHINKNGVAGPVHSTSGVTATTVGIDTVDFQDLAVTSAKIANLAVDSAKIADLAVTNAKISELNASKINAGFLVADRIQAQSLDIGGKAASGTMGKVAFTDVQQTNSPPNVTFDLTDFFGGNPLTTAAGANMTNLVNFQVDFPSHSGSAAKNYVAVCSFKPLGSFPVGSQIITTFSMTSSGTASTQPSIFKQIFSTEALAGTLVMLTLLVSVPSGATRYFRVHGNFKNVNFFGTQRGFGDIAVHVSGLSA